MGRLILLVIIGLVAAMYFPDSRAVLLANGEPVLRPIFAWNAIREIGEITTGLQQMENVEHRLPERLEYVDWLEKHYTPDAARDAWGSLYGYELKPDSFAIVSNGPDRLFKTGDDIRDVRIRNWRAKGKGRP
ncbi:MAG: hypothetical protein EXR95_06190 [Gemmatimonadetes bacterium]|nr:hypothetical protein [Gemmatimonadota bacterium]